MGAFNRFETYRFTGSQLNKMLDTVEKEVKILKQDHQEEVEKLKNKIESLKKKKNTIRYIKSRK